MTEHEKDIKEIRALESIAKSLKSIDFYLKKISDAEDVKLGAVSINNYTGKETEESPMSTIFNPTELICPKCGHKGCYIVLGSTYAICPNCREMFDLNK